MARTNCSNVLHLYQVFPCCTVSGKAHRSLVITGVPHIIASTATPPKGSRYIVGTNTPLALLISIPLSSTPTSPIYSICSHSSTISLQIILFHSTFSTHCPAIFNFTPALLAASTAICTHFLSISLQIYKK